MDPDTVKIICRCIPGFENIAIKECEEKLQTTTGLMDVRGRISIELNINDLPKLQQLRSVSHYWVIVTEQQNYFDPLGTNEDFFSKLEQLPSQLQWEKSLRAWKVFKLNYKAAFNNVYAEKTENKRVNDKNKQLNEETKINNDQKEIENSDIADASVECINLNDIDPDSADASVERINLNDIDPLIAGEKLSFRVTATRTGKHNFSSMNCAVHFGGGVNDHFKWKVDLTHFHIEVVLFILQNAISIGIQLTEDDQASRNITHFGPTVLKANISYCLQQFVQVSEGDIVCDPMCGSGSISLEGASSFANTYHVSGDNHPIGVQYASENLEALQKLKGDSYSLPVNFIRWDVYQLPLRTSSVDRIISDLPFGKKMGNKDRNMFLYPVALREMARICRPFGKAALLTQHRGAMANAVKKCSLWKQIEIRKIFMGGIDVSVYLLLRTTETVVPK